MLHLWQGFLDAPWPSFEGFPRSRVCKRFHIANGFPAYVCKPAPVGVLGSLREPESVRKSLT